MLDGYVLTARTAADVKQLLADGGAVGGRVSPGAAARGTTWVKVTGSPTSGWHPGVVTLDVDGTWSDLTDAVKVAAADGSTLTTGSRYLCTRTGDDTGSVARFRTVAQTTSAGLAVKEADGSPSYTGAVTLQFDQADGFVVSNPGGAGVVQIDLAAASATQNGVLTTGAQTLAGDKTLNGAFTVRDDLTVQSTGKVIVLSTAGGSGGGSGSALTVYGQVACDNVNANKLNVNSVLNADTANGYAVMNGGYTIGTTGGVKLTGKTVGGVPTCYLTSAAGAAGVYSVYDGTTDRKGYTGNVTLSDGGGGFKTLKFSGGICSDIV